MQHCGFPLEVLHGVPGFKPILKAIIRAQILSLVNQLAEQTGEQMVILSADVSEQTLCQFGSGDGFLAAREDVQKDFLQHCVDKHNHCLGMCRNDDNVDETDDYEKVTAGNSGLISNKTRRKSVAAKLDSSKLKGVKTRKRKKVLEEANVDNGGKEVDEIAKDQLDDCLEGKTIRKVKGRKRKTEKSGSVAVITDEEAHSSDKPSDIISDTNSSVNDFAEAEEEITQAADTDRSSDPEKANDTFKLTHSDSGTLAEKDDNDEVVVKSRRTGKKKGLKTDNREEISDEQAFENKHAKSGRKTVSGQALGDDLRTSIILKVMESGGDVKTGSVPRGIFTSVSRALGVNVSSVTRIWERYVNDGTVKPRQPVGKT